MYLKETVQTQIQENWQENFLKRGKMLMMTYSRIAKEFKGSFAREGDP